MPRNPEIGALIVRVLVVVVVGGAGYGLGEGLSSVLPGLPLFGSGRAGALTLANSLLVVGESVGAVGLAACGVALVVSLTLASAWLEPRVRSALPSAVDALVGTPARLVGTVAGLALWASVGAMAALVVRRAEMTPPFLALLTAITTTAMLALAALPAVAAGSALQRLLERAGRLVPPAVLLALAVALAVCVQKVAGSPFGLAVALATLGVVVAARLRGRFAVVVAVITGVWGAVALGLAGRSPDVDAAVAAAPVTEGLLAAARRVFDRDGDGFATVLGGGDCDDRDPRVHPWARDLPENGRDENCSGADARPFRLPREQPAAVPGSVPRDLSIVLITIDAVRADHVGAYGYARPTTPSLDALARQGTLFERAYAPASSTRQTFPALFTGRSLAHLPYSEKTNHYVLERSATTLAELLRDAGFSTFGAPSSAVFRVSPGIEQGFESWVGSGDVSAPQIAATVRRFLDDAARPTAGRFFLWAHLGEPHNPYVAHPDVPAWPGTVGRYDGEIRFADERGLGQILSRLDQPDLRSKVAIVVTADHGEMLGEHGIAFHGLLYEPAIRVPLIVRTPGLPAGQRVRGPVSLLDVAPTLLSLARVPAPASLEGRSLVGPLADGRSPRPRPIFAECRRITGDRNVMAAVIAGDEKLILDLTARRFELYDVRRDPGETRNLAHDRPGQRRRLAESLDAWMSVGHVGGRKLR